MELTLWTYEGPPHVGAMRIAASMEGVHYVLHAPQGDTYADLLFTMIERRDRRPPVTYTTFQARDLGGDTAELVKRSIAEAVERFKPEALLVGESCTAELIQDQPGALAAGMDLGGIPMVSLELPAYSKKENWGAAETFYQLVRGLLKPQLPPPGSPKPDPARWRAEGRRPRVNLLGPSLLGFRCRDDVRELSTLLGGYGIDVAVVAPLGARPADLMRIPDADANVNLYPELAGPACSWLERQFGMASVGTVPIGIGATVAFLRELHSVLQLELPAELQPGADGVCEAERRSLCGGGPGQLQPRAGPRGACRGRRAGAGGPDHRRLPRRGGRHGGGGAGAGARHADGAPQRQAPRPPLCRDQRAAACAGRTCPLQPADGL
jgi:light-independent protochlorophyllide reductase subunit B